MTYKRAYKFLLAVAGLHVQRQIKRSLENCDAYTLVKKFQQLEEERVYTYHLFNEGHKLYLTSGYTHEPFVRFRQLVHEVTQEFKRISEEISSIEKRLREESGEAEISVANLIAAVQEDEKNKLELTASIQLAKQGYVSHPDEPERQVDMITLRKRLIK
uniref:Uncharacterized protein n=1 Tax=Strigamia maritima TaxID=126957 RepID=T1J7G3_STRMM